MKPTIVFPDLYGRPTEFFSIEDYPRYAISRLGSLLDLDTKKFIRGWRSKTGYVHFKLLNAGGKTTLKGRHRLLAIVFIPTDGDKDKLQVNHINGIPGSDAISNLEWATPKENIEHSGALGLTPKCLPIDVMDVDTNKVTKYSSILAGAIHLGLSKDSVRYRVKSDGQRVFPERKLYKLSTSSSVWRVSTNIDLEIKRFGHVKPVMLRHLLSGEELMFDNQNELAAYLRRDISTISTWLSCNNQPVLPGLIQIKRAESDEPWREVTDPYMELEQFSKKRVIIVTRIGCEIARIYESAADCARAHRLKPTTLSMRLKSGGRIVYDDGCTYKYYTQQ